MYGILDKVKAEVYNPTKVLSSKNDLMKIVLIFLITVNPRAEIAIGAEKKSIFLDENLVLVGLIIFFLFRRKMQIIRVKRVPTK